jgi:tRNA pseudouridine38-40 synthase
VIPPPPTGGSGDDSVRWRLKIAYNGAGFHGFAAQDGQPTVAGAVQTALGRLCRTDVVLTCAGRTDSGVHALDQVVHFDVPAEVSRALDPAAVVKSCNSQLAPAIVVRQAEVAPPGFDARHSATARRYRYLVVNAPFADPLLAGLAWHVSDPLDLRSMQAAADALLGEHDFRAFCRRVPGTSPDDPIHRRVIDARWSRLDRSAGTSRSSTGTAASRSRATQLISTEPAGAEAVGYRAPPSPWLAPVTGSLLAFEIEANAFCHQMVRSLVGTLVDVGRGRNRASDMLWIIRSADRQRASQPAPPQGLTLTAVRYGR